MLVEIDGRQYRSEDLAVVTPAMLLGGSGGPASALKNFPNTQESIVRIKARKAAAETRIRTVNSYRIKRVPKRG